ncbi:MAG: hypothetical protein VKQ33_16435 [Candidatus Sericytochromatia bacterium]|nr:hypothetical protein [Candidatus Sericytochromatia bacterium]
MPAATRLLPTLLALTTLAGCGRAPLSAAAPVRATARTVASDYQGGPFSKVEVPAHVLAYTRAHVARVTREFASLPASRERGTTLDIFASLEASPDGWKTRLQCPNPLRLKVDDAYTSGRASASFALKAPVGVKVAYFLTVHSSYSGGYGTSNGRFAPEVINDYGRNFRGVTFDVYRDVPRR